MAADRVEALLMENLPHLLDEQREEELRLWARRLWDPLLSIDPAKAPKVAAKGEARTTTRKS